MRGDKYVGGAAQAVRDHHQLQTLESAIRRTKAAARTDWNSS